MNHAPVAQLETEAKVGGAAALCWKVAAKVPACHSIQPERVAGLETGFRSSGAERPPGSEKPGKLGLAIAKASHQIVFKSPGLKSRKVRVRVPSAALRLPRAWSYSKWTRLATLSLLAGGILRLGWILVHPPFDHVYSDMSFYVEYANELVAGSPLARGSQLFPPGTSLVLAAVLKPFDLMSRLFSSFDFSQAARWTSALLWCSLSVLTAFFAWRLAHVIGGPAAGAITAFLSSFWPLHIGYAGYFLSETPSSAFITGALWLIYRGRLQQHRHPLGWAIPAGMLAGAAIVTRTAFVLNLALALTPMVFGLRRYKLALGGTLAAMATLVAVVGMIQLKASGHPTVFGENAGVNFLQGHCDVNAVVLGQPGGYWLHLQSPTHLQKRTGRTYIFPSQRAWDHSFFLNQGIACIRQDGSQHVFRIFRNIGDLFATTVPWPFVSEEPAVRSTAKAVNWGYSATLPVVILGALILQRRDRPHHQLNASIVFLSHLFCIAIVAILFYGDPRLRIPYDVFGLALLATAASQLLSGKSTALKERL